jgi:hypothetical protein
VSERSLVRVSWCGNCIVVGEGECLCVCVCVYGGGGGVNKRGDDDFLMRMCEEGVVGRRVFEDEMAGLGLCTCRCEVTRQ